ncbi:MAG: tetratricopeptide repeat protein [Bacteroidales bacterium]|nr:tetratricopeptide repeat protein [Bacteroidales bacterium]
MKYNLIKSILFITLFSFLVSCNNQPASEKQSAGQEDTASAFESSKPDKETVLSAEPDEKGSVTIDLAEQADGIVNNQETALLFNKGTTAFSNGDFAAGVEFFKEIVSKNPDNRKAWYNLGLGYFKLERFAESLQAFSRAIEILPDDAISIQYRGRVYYMMGNYAKARDDYDRVLELKPDDAVAWYNRGTAFGALKLYRKALEDFNKAIELDDDYALAYFNRGLAHYFLGMMHEACVDWRKAHNLGHYEAEKALRTYCESNE